MEADKPHHHPWTCFTSSGWNASIFDPPEWFCQCMYVKQPSYYVLSLTAHVHTYTSYYDILLHIYGHIHLTMTCTCKLRILTYIICICDVSIGKCAFTKVMTNWIHKSDWSWPFCCIHECLHLTAESVVACCAYIWTILLICKYVCMHVCMHVCMYVCMYVCMHCCWYCVQVWLWTTRTWRALTLSMLRICRFVCTYVCMYVRMYVCMHVCTYICAYTHTYIHKYVLYSTIYMAMIQASSNDICQLSSLG